MTKSTFRVEGVANSLWSEDLAPVEQENRTWNAVTLIPLWAAMAISLPTYLFAGGLVALGMSVGTVFGSVLAGSIVVALLAIGCAHAGVRYGIPFAVLARTAFGVVGANVAVAMRLLVGCVWVGIGCWLGAEAIFAMLSLLAPLTPLATLWICFGACLLAVATPLRRDWGLVAGVLLGACFLLSYTLSVWIELQTRGVMVLAVHPVLLLSERLSLGRGMALGVTSLLGLWLPLGLGASDLGRRIRSQRSLIWSICAMPVAMLMFGGLVTAIVARAVGRGSFYWNPVSLAQEITRTRLALLCLALLAAVALLIARPLCGWLGEQMAGLMPTRVSVMAGRCLVCVASTLTMPWRWVASPERYIGQLLTGCAGLLAPIAAILLVEFFALRRRWLNVDDLYQRDGLYEYSDGWNWKAFGALGSGWAVMLAVAFVPALERALDGAVWLGAGVSALLYWVLRSGPPDVALIPPNPLLIPLAGFESEGASS